MSWDGSIESAKLSAPPKEPPPRGTGWALLVFVMLMVSPFLWLLSRLP